MEMEGDGQDTSGGAPRGRLPPSRQTGDIYHSCPEADYSAPQIPCWRFGRRQGEGNRTFIVENTWGAQIVDELELHEGEQLIIKKGFVGFSNTSLDLVLRDLGVTACVVSGGRYRPATLNVAQFSQRRRQVIPLPVVRGSGCSRPCPVISWPFCWFQ